MKTEQLIEVWREERMRSVPEALAESKNRYELKYRPIYDDWDGEWEGIRGSALTSVPVAGGNSGLPIGLLLALTYSA